MPIRAVSLTVASAGPLADSLLSHWASGGYHPASISVRSVHDAVPTRTCPRPAGPGPQAQARSIRTHGAVSSQATAPAHRSRQLRTCVHGAAGNYALSRALT